MYDDETLEMMRERTRPVPGQAYSARINNTVAADGEDVYVKIPAIDGGQYRWGPCVWSPRIGDQAFPSKNYVCLVIFDNEHVPWIVQWWPYG